MRKPTAPITGAIPAQPGPQDAAESTNGVLPGAGPAGGRPTRRPAEQPWGVSTGGRQGARSADSPAGSAGSAGSAGLTSDAGPAMPAGLTSDAGPAGLTSDAMPVGLTSDAGPAGLTGAAGPAEPTTSAVPTASTGWPTAWAVRRSSEHAAPVDTRSEDGPGRSEERQGEGLTDGSGTDRAGTLAHSPTAPTAPAAPSATGGQPTDGPAPSATGRRLTDGPAPPATERGTLRLRRDRVPGAPATPTEPTTPTTPGHTDDPPRYAPEWLRLREPADAAARAHDLLDPLRIRLANLPSRADGLVVHDVGCGTGSMGRWLAPLLDGAQHWVLHDRDPYLLHFAAVGAPRSAADGCRVTVETRRGDLARLTPDALAGAGLVTASALLDVLTAEEVGILAAACAAAGCPALLTLSVAGRVELTPAHPLDAEITEAFNDHQRRTGMLGPDAVTCAAETFAAHGATVRTHPSDWRLGADEAALAEQWLRGWVGAAVEQRPELGEPARRYLGERLAACAAGELRVVVHHTDLLALCRPTGGTA